MGRGGRRTAGQRRNAPAEVIWRPQPGSQALFLSCPHFECLYEGTRGPGKTDAMLMDFAQHVGCGHGAAWKGVLLREEAAQLEDIIARSRRWFPRIFPGARLLERPKSKWVFPDGEELLFRHMRRAKDYWKYHGHEYPWIGWEELTNWASPACYDAMKACCRSSDPRVPRKYRATCNPYGIGHAWVKARFVDPAPPGVPVVEADGRARVRLHGTIHENRILLAADPGYLRSLEAIAEPNLRKAWLEGSWDIVAGGMFDDVWNPEVHILARFAVPPAWRVDRSFDWGSARPFSVGWWAESDGGDVVVANGRRRTTAPGDLFRIAEWYGWNGRPNEGCRLPAREVARGILEREEAMGLTGRVRPGPADSAIFDVDRGRSIADDMAAVGVRWERADKSPGSRRAGAELLRARLKAAAAREGPGLYVFDACRHFIRTVPVLPRSERDPEDVDSAAEDHVYDETRYRIGAARSLVTSEEFRV